MKKIFLLIAVVSFTFSVQAQLLKKIKDKVNNTVDKTLSGKNQTEVEKKENDAADEYSDAVENNEKPVFVDMAPANGKMIVKLKKGDKFWGGYIQVNVPPKATDAGKSILDYATARVGSIYSAGEMSASAVYINGQRTQAKQDNDIIPLRPEYFDASKDTGYMVTTDARVDMSGYNPMAAAAQVQANGSKPLSKKEEEALQKNFTPGIAQATFAFKNAGKQYGPWQGTGEGMFILKSMDDGKPSGKFYGFGVEMLVGEKGITSNAIIQTEKKIIKIPDAGGAQYTYPTGAMAVAFGKAAYFTNGKTIPIPVNPAYKTAGSLVGEEVYATDSGHVVIIPKYAEQMQAGILPKTVYIDYNTKLSFAAEVDKKHLLVASNPAKSIVYRNHKIYYPDGSEETLFNVGDVQLCGFNGKDYIVWFEMIKQADGHEVYICSKELK